jgi:Family of unknown function (DUF5670)
MFVSLFSIYFLSRLSATGSSRELGQEAMMLAKIAALLLVLWLLGFLAFHIAFGAIHLLLVAAVVLFFVHFLTSRSAAT